MSLLKYIERLKRMDDLIRRKATGKADEFATKLGISRSQLLQDVKELRELGAPIAYCYTSQSYIYTRPYSLTFNMEIIRGGKNIFNFFDRSSMAGLPVSRLPMQLGVIELPRIPKSE
ncbi:MAG: HTH domain-containing protein [Bacteroidota bacterium]|nr:HTH domain-containing protein [Bacteroidota bacterium]